MKPDKKIINVQEIPLNKIPFKATFSIASNGITDFTHGFFKYPCKFIPHIPRWAINYYLGKKEGVVLDPFCGSGTTLVESALAGKVALGIDYDPFSQLLSRVKSTKLSKKGIKTLREDIPPLIQKYERSNIKVGPPPEIPNVDLWFDKRTIDEMNRLRWMIKNYSEEVNNKKIENFLKLCLGAIVRKVSLADDQSPKPYVSRKIKKKPELVFQTFADAFNKYIERIESFSQFAKGNGGIIIGSDARAIDKKQIIKYASKGVDLVITSPPYINAFDYSRTLKLENFWLDLITPSQLAEYRKKQIGTEYITSSEYKDRPPISEINMLNPILEKIYRGDKKRASVVYKFFEDMKKNISEVFLCLKKGGVYCIIIGDSEIRHINVPTHEILIEIVKTIGFKIDLLFSYIIKNRYLRFPRNGRGGYISKDWVIALRK